jgi:hypothetical protein
MSPFRRETQSLECPKVAYVVEKRARRKAILGGFEEVTALASITFSILAALIATFWINSSQFGVYVSPNAGIGTGGHRRLAILRKFCATAASRNSS